MCNRARALKRIVDRFAGPQHQECPLHEQRRTPAMIRLPFNPSAFAIAALFGLAIISIASADETKPLIKRLDDATRAKVLAALAALIILGFAMVLLTWLGARITQRYRHSSPVHKPTPRPSEHEWARKPLSNDDP